MEIGNLWGDISPATEETPIFILKEQASLLGKLTKNILEGKVRVDQGPISLKIKPSALPQTGIVCRLSVVAKALDSYQFQILTVQYSMTMYPLLIKDSTKESGAVTCADSKEFIKELGKILSSEAVQKVISSLLRQSKDIAAS
ncbi:MAG: hypothetical protein GY765_04590 [bacterium]|nr:hypothetical protein [bacterium]